MSDEDGARRRCRIVLIDDHELLAHGLRDRLVGRGCEVLIAELLPVDDLVRWCSIVAPDLVVLDLGLPYEGGGVRLVEPLVAQGLRVVNLTGETDLALWAACFDAGSFGIIDKAEPLDRVIESILLACDGEAFDTGQRDHVMSVVRRGEAERARLLEPFSALTRREAAVLDGLMMGLSAAQLAERDFVAIETVRSQIKSLMRKLDVRTQLEAVTMAHSVGWSSGGGAGS